MAQMRAMTDEQLERAELRFQGWRTAQLPTYRFVFHLLHQHLHQIQALAPTTVAKCTEVLPLSGGQTFVEENAEYLGVSVLNGTAQHIALSVVSDREVRFRIYKQTDGGRIAVLDRKEHSRPTGLARRIHVRAGSKEVANIMDRKALPDSHSIPLAC
jgi:hypothetical protein